MKIQLNDYNLITIRFHYFRDNRNQKVTACVIDSPTWFSYGEVTKFYKDQDVKTIARNNALAVALKYADKIDRECIVSVLALNGFKFF